MKINWISLIKKVRQNYSEMPFSYGKLRPKHFMVHQMDEDEGIVAGDGN